MAKEIHISGLILAGGAGKRVHGEDKGLLAWRGKRLIEHVAGRFRPQVDHLIISCNRNIEVYAQIADAIVQDDRGDFQGPLAGIEAAQPLKKSDYLIVVACDTPLLPTDLVQRLLSPLESGGTLAPVISYANDGSRDQYLFCGYPHFLSTLSQALSRYRPADGPTLASLTSFGGCAPFRISKARLPTTIIWIPRFRNNDIPGAQKKPEGFRPAGFLLPVEILTITTPWPLV